ncbi:sporulation protein [Pseudalkalibacillus caeni]|uniref:Sporulation protein n=1 Tax=Exobacillus caeni TaxID=2574798 RepID=A0A5R9EYX9_9BACL|nr:sporulation protein [Pseudalkalibacillus caeni]TLS36041.1 sporulation protein [Pseudalkalibacillus caeni]
MLLRKYMSLLGIGAAKIDLLLEKDSYKPGESVKGIFLIKGGTIEQKICRIECDLVKFDKEDQKEHVIDSTMVLTSKKIQSEGTMELVFQFQLAEDLPASCNRINYRFKTRMCFDEGVQSEDHDLINIISD